MLLPVYYEPKTVAALRTLAGEVLWDSAGFLSQQSSASQLNSMWMRITGIFRGLEAGAVENSMKKHKAEDKSLNDEQEQEYVRRAMVEWYKAGGRDIPSASSSVQEHKDRYYVELHDIAGTLAVYRIYNDDTLKAMKRWPPELECTLEAMKKVEAKAKKRQLGA